MDEAAFRTPEGRAVPAVTATEMREVDRVAVEEVRLSILMMMEHAGRGLAETVLERTSAGLITVLAGGSGNGGGGLCAARHLTNHGRAVDVVLGRDPSELAEAPSRQWRILGDAVTDRSDDPQLALEQADVVVDALVGYSLSGAPRGRLAELVGIVADQAEHVISLDVPTGVVATSGARPGVAIDPDVTVTLALPKTGLLDVDGELLVTDIGIPDRVYVRSGLDVSTPFEGHAWRVPLERSRG